ncbi:ECF-type sigma factor [Pelagicoccus sp. SDUM812003]|uniref:ECF-type sigma factor n=1 Tax=Pelagicoccus sp. SDUM812003 TaxID=3041267 RepID=UPI00280F4ADD|nr:ECF-type sigma factor [Pelagicoccus sp. SDUM812003]MDQ8203494.1 ECF-type sigma factor [Pelagicoccus sp. SDUM812003]
MSQQLPNQTSPAENVHAPFKQPGSQYRLSHEVYEKLRRIARSRMSRLPSEHTTLQPTVLVHEAWLQLNKNERSWQNQGHFIASATLTMRRILIDHARRKSTIRKAIGDKTENTEAIHEEPPAAHLLELDEAINALEAAHPVHARVVVAKFFGGLLNKEVSKELGISERSVERYWAFSKVWLLRWMERKSARLNAD